MLVGILFPNLREGKGYFMANPKLSHVLAMHNHSVIEWNSPPVARDAEQQYSNSTHKNLIFKHIFNDSDFSSGNSQMCIIENLRAHP